mgnify:CR=1 FL=1
MALLPFKATFCATKNSTRLPITATQNRGMNSGVAIIERPPITPIEVSTMPPPT